MAQILAGISKSDHSGLGQAGGYIILSKFTAERSGAVSTFYIYMAGACNAKVAVYSDSGGQPGTLMGGVSTPQACVAGWNAITLAGVSIVSETDYWLASLFDAGPPDYGQGFHALAGAQVRLRAQAFAGYTWETTLSGLSSANGNVFEMGCFDSDPTTHVLVGTSTTPGAYVLSYDWSRKLHYANGRFWAFYSATDASFGFRSSVDGAAWSPYTAIKSPGNCGSHAFCFAVQGTKVHYAYTDNSNGGDVFYRRGTLNANGTITWDSAELVAYAVPGGYQGLYPSIEVDSGGYPHIGFLRLTNPSTHPYSVIVTKSSTNDGTWSTASGFPYTLWTGSTYYGWAIPIALTNGKVYWAYLKNSYNAALSGRLWNGSAWEAEESPGVTSFYGRVNMSAEGDDIRLVSAGAYGGNYGIFYLKRTYGVGWGSPESIYGNSSCNANLAYVGAGDAVALILDSTEKYIYYRRLTDEVWGELYDLYDESALGFPSFYLQHHLQYVGGLPCALYVRKSSSPYEVIFCSGPGTCAENPEIETLGSSDVRHDRATLWGNITVLAGADAYGFDWSLDTGAFENELLGTDPIISGLFRILLTGLNYLTSYKFRAKIRAAGVWYYGSELTFTTTAAVPVVRTDPPSSVTPTSFDANGTITSVGGDPTCDKVGVVYGLTSNPDPGNVGPGASDYTNYQEQAGSFGTGSFTLNISSLTQNKIYYMRDYAHNSYGYSYGAEAVSLTNPNVNILYPSADYSKGIRFDTSPGGGYPPYGGSVPHYILVRTFDSHFVPGGWWGFVTGNFVYEQHYYNYDYYFDLFTMSNPTTRTGTVIKIKWKAHPLGNSYGYARYKRKLVTHGTQYTGTGGICSGEPGMVCEIFYNNPYTEAPWTIAELDDLQAGIGITGGGWPSVACCDYLEVRVLWANAAVSTDGSTSLGGTLRRLHGTVLEDEAEACLVYFQWGATTAYGNATTQQTKAKGDAFTADIDKGALPSIHYRTVIVTTCGETFYGEDRTDPVPAPPAQATIPHRLVSGGFI